MIQFELCAEDRTRLDNFLEYVGAINRQLGDVVVSCTESARLLGVTPKTISAMIRDGRLTKVTIDGSTGIRLSEIERKRREA